MVDIILRLETDAESETHRIANLSEEEARQFVDRGLRERWLSKVIRCLNQLERKPATATIARRALERLGFPIAQ